MMELLLLDLSWSNLNGCSYFLKRVLIFSSYYNCCVGYNLTWHSGCSNGDVQWRTRWRCSYSYFWFNSCQRTYRRWCSLVRCCFVSQPKGLCWQYSFCRYRFFFLITLTEENRNSLVYSVSVSPISIFYLFYNDDLWRWDDQWFFCTFRELIFTSNQPD